MTPCNVTPCIVTPCNVAPCNVAPFKAQAWRGAGDQPLLAPRLRSHPITPNPVQIVESL